MRLRSLAAALALAAAFPFAAACRRGQSRSRNERSPSAGAGGPSAWELVYDRETSREVTANLYVIPAGGGAERRLTEGPAYDSLARWTPDGRAIVFTSSRTGKPQLWQVDGDGKNLRRLRTNDATEYQADVSPDGKTLALLSNLDGPERLVLQDRATGATRELVRQGEDTIFGNPHWSPDGRLVAFSSNWRIGHQIYVVDVATKEVRRISPLASGGCEPRFNRDGKKLAYVSRGHLGSSSRLVEHDLATGEEKALVSWPALNYDPVYSPDGSELAFASNVAGSYAIYRQRLSDGQAWRVTFGPGDARNPDYRPVR